MNENKHNQIILTISGLLIAVLLVWAQLWTSTAQMYMDVDKFANMNSVAYGLVIIYWAVFSLLVVIICVIVQKRITFITKICFAFAMLLTIVEVVFMSLIPVLRKTIIGSSDNASLFWQQSNTINLQNNHDALILIGLPVSFFVLAFLWKIFVSNNKD